MSLSTEEARLLAVHRAIARLDSPELVRTGEASQLTYFLDEFADLNKLEKKYSAEEMQAFLDGYTMGFAVFKKVAFSED